MSDTFDTTVLVSERFRRKMYAGFYSMLVSQKVGSKKVLTVCWFLAKYAGFFEFLWSKKAMLVSLCWFPDLQLGLPAK